jgi:hypothetical protein
MYLFDCSDYFCSQENKSLLKAMLKYHNLRDKTYFFLERYSSSICYKVC